VGVLSMGVTTAETIKEITRNHLENGNGLLLGQCVTAVGWIGGTVPDCRGIVEIPMTDVAAGSFACGAALMGRRPIFVVRYQGFMWLNSSPLINYAARSKEIWGRSVPIFIRAIAMEGNGIGPSSSSSVHSIFMHAPGMPVVAPMTPEEYRQAWNYYMEHDDPLYVSEHRRSFTLHEEFADEYEDDADVTILAISAARLNAVAAVRQLREQGVKVNLHHVVWLKPFQPSERVLEALKRSKVGIVIDSDFEIAGASQSFAYELMLRTGTPVHALGLEDRVCGVAPELENITPSSERIVQKVHGLLSDN